MNFLEKFHNFSSLEINKAKYFFTIGALNGPRDTVTKSITGFKKSELPMIYLGCPLYKSKIVNMLFHNTFDKVNNKLSGWKGKLLSMGGKLILIQSVIHAMPSYLLALIQPTKAISRALCKLMLDFFAGMIQHTNISITSSDGPNFVALEGRWSGFEKNF